MSSSLKSSLPNGHALAIGGALWALSIFIAVVYRPLMEGNLENVSPTLVGLPFALLTWAIVWYASTAEKYSLSPMQKWMLLSPVILLLSIELPRCVYDGIDIVYLEPGRDRVFLDTKPSRSQAVEYFDDLIDTVGPGESFPAAGWQPLPTESAVGSGAAFSRRNGKVFYIFFDADGRYSHHYLTSS